MGHLRFFISSRSGNSETSLSSGVGEESEMRDIGSGGGSGEGDCDWVESWSQ